MAEKVAFPGLCLLFRLRGNRRCRKVVVYYHELAFARKAEALAELLLKRGIPTEVRSGMSLWTRVLLTSSPDLWIGFWNNVPLLLLPRNYIFWNAEPLNVTRWSDNADWRDAMKSAKVVWGYTRSNLEYIEKLGVPFTVVPFGYAPYYETAFRKCTAGKNLPQDIDVFFFGWVTERRRRILDELKQRGMNVQVASETNPVLGDQLDELLARSKIVLGIHGFDEPQAQIPDFARVDHLLSNRLFVVHERPSALASHPKFEQNVITCEYRDIPDTCAYFLARPEERASKAARAYEWFKSEYPLDAFIPYEQVRSMLRQK
jgi:hypothetical protein